MSTPYCRGGRVISLQMGSAVSQLLLPKATDLQPVCQRAHWIIHIMRLLLHLLSRCGGVGVSGEGAHLVIWDRVTHAPQPILSICLCQLWYVLPILKFNSVYRAAIWLFPERMDLFFQAGAWLYFQPEGYTRVDFSLSEMFPVQSQSCERKKMNSFHVPVFLLHILKDYSGNDFDLM